MKLQNIIGWCTLGELTQEKLLKYHYLVFDNNVILIISSKHRIFKNLIQKISSFQKNFESIAQRNQLRFIFLGVQHKHFQRGHPSYYYSHLNIFIYKRSCHGIQYNTLLLLSVDGSPSCLDSQPSEVASSGFGLWCSSEAKVQLLLTFHPCLDPLICFP